MTFFTTQYPDSDHPKFPDGLTEAEFKHLMSLPTEKARYDYLLATYGPQKTQELTGFGEDGIYAPLDPVSKSPVLVKQAFEFKPDGSVGPVSKINPGGGDL